MKVLRWAAIIVAVHNLWSLLALIACRWRMHHSLVRQEQVVLKPTMHSGAAHSAAPEYRSTVSSRGHGRMRRGVTRSEPARGRRSRAAQGPRIRRVRPASDPAAEPERELRRKASDHGGSRAWKDGGCKGARLARANAPSSRRRRATSARDAAHPQERHSRGTECARRRLSFRFA
jgi:hypothetical protein